MYICIENGKVLSILNYEPAVPSSVEVIKLSEEEHALLQSGSHIFDVENKKIVLKTEDNKQEYIDNKTKNLQYLYSTDWMVLRHIRQKALGLPTSLSEQEYLELESKRNLAASAA